MAAKDRVINWTSTRRYRPKGRAAYLDGKPWDLTGAAVTLTIRAPDGTEASVTATIDDAAGGSFYADAKLSTLFPDYTGLEDGDRTNESWTRTYRIVQGDIDVTMVPPVAFLVVGAP